MRIGNWVRITEVSERYKFPLRTLQRWCKSGKLKARKVGKLWHINLTSDEPELQVMLDEMKRDLTT